MCICVYMCMCIYIYIYRERRPPSGASGTANQQPALSFSRMLKLTESG